MRLPTSVGAPMPKSGSAKTAECDDADELTRQGVDMLGGQLAFWAQGEW
jgi:hypothetical protein